MRDAHRRGVAVQWTSVHAVACRIDIACHGNASSNTPGTLCSVHLGLRRLCRRGLPRRGLAVCLTAGPCLGGCLAAAAARRSRPFCGKTALRSSWPLRASRRRMQARCTVMNRALLQRQQLLGVQLPLRHLRRMPARHRRGRSRRQPLPEPADSIHGLWRVSHAAVCRPVRQNESSDRDLVSARLATAHSHASRLLQHVVTWPTWTMMQTGYERHETWRCCP